MGGGCGGVSHFFLLISRLQDTGGEWGGGGCGGARGVDRQAAEEGWVKGQGSCGQAADGSI